MQHSFTQFIRSGGNGEFILSHTPSGWIGHGPGWSVKSIFPDYETLKTRFEEQLDDIITANTDDLISDLAEFFRPPLTAGDLPDISDARREALAEWDSRLKTIWTEWNSHPQRLRPVRQSMEDQLLRGFSGLINEMRQRDLGFEAYVWRSRDDGKVRRAHAAYDDQVFRWDTPPADGHPGQAHNCRCHAEPFIPGITQNVKIAPDDIPDGYSFRYENANRAQILRNAAAEVQVLRPALEALAGHRNKTAEQEAEQRALAQAFRDAAFRYALAAPVPDALVLSDLLFGPDAEQQRLLAETAAYRQGALDLARGMASSDFFDGIGAGAVLAELRLAAPSRTDAYLDALIQLTGARHISQDLLSGRERRNLHRDLGRNLVAAARGIEEERWGGRPQFRHKGELAQWDGLHAEFQRIAATGTSEVDARAVQDGIFEETGRRFYPEVLSGISGGIIGAIGRAAPRQVRLTSEMLDDTGRFLGQHNAGPNTPRFGSWLSKPGNVAEIMPGGQIRYTTRIDAARSVFNGKSVSVAYTNGVPDFSQLGVARVTIPNPVGRGVGVNSKADLKAASRVLWQEIQAGRVSRGMFTQKQLDKIAAGEDRIPELTWHHDGITLNPDGTGPMLLLDRAAHKAFRHVGWTSKINK